MSWVASVHSVSFDKHCSIYEHKIIRAKQMQIYTSVRSSSRISLVRFDYRCSASRYRTFRGAWYALINTCQHTHTNTLSTCYLIQLHQITYCILINNLQQSFQELTHFTQWRTWSCSRNFTWKYYFNLYAVHYSFKVSDPFSSTGKQFFSIKIGLNGLGLLVVCIHVGSVSALMVSKEWNLISIMMHSWIFKQ